MKKILTSVLVSALVIGPALADGKPTPPSNVCVVQIANVLHNAPQVQKATENLKSQFKEDQTALEKKQKAIQEKVAELEKNTAVMSQKEKDAAQTAITKDRQALVGEMGSFQQKLGDAQNKVMKEVFDSLNAVIKDVAKAQHCDVVLDSQFVVYATPPHDVTKPVQDAFNSKK